MILIANDGSADAQAAIEQAGVIMSGTPATVLTVWEPFNDVVARVGGSGLPVAALDFEDVDRSHQEQAQRRAAEGVESGAQAIVLGTSGLTGVKSLLMGSVSNAVMRHADRPVMVVPSPEVADGRRQPS
jgi:nucleotide-binding universal stress UspA family protein